MADSQSLKPTRSVLLVSNLVMHYRVNVYNHFAGAFSEDGYHFAVRATSLQAASRVPVEFDFAVFGTKFALYKAEVLRMRPVAVILFLHLKEPLFWRLAHWLKANGIPVIFWTKGGNLDRPSSIVSRALYRYVHRLCDGLVLYSGDQLGLVDSRLHGKVTVAWNTLNQHSLPEVHDGAGVIKEEFGIPFEKYAVFVGRMGINGGRKRVDHAIEVFSRIDMPGCGLVIVGSGMTDELRASMNSKNTLYLGELHDPDDIQVSRILYAADLALIPGHVGLGLNHAFFYGLPLVTERGMQPPEFGYLVHGRNGVVVPDGNIDALTEKVRELFLDDDQRGELSRNAYADIRQLATVERMYSGFKDAVIRFGSRHVPAEPTS
jgi:glycosyltransferase involved in cell wall biosynthesis